MRPKEDALGSAVEMVATDTFAQEVVVPPREEVTFQSAYHILGIVVVVS